MILTSTLKAHGYLIDALESELKTFCLCNQITLDMFNIDLNLFKKQLYVRIESTNKQNLDLVIAYLESFQTKK